jgi:ferredoxin
LLFAWRYRSTLKCKLGERLLSPSSRALIREARQVSDYSFLDLLHAYVYARWPYVYIGVGTGEHWLSRHLEPLLGWLERLILPQREGEAASQAWADSYHGKVVPLESAKQLVTVDREISLTNLEPIIPYARARDIVLQHPDHIVVMECPCRAVRPEPCQPLDVCLVIGEPFASFVAEHHPKRSRWITPDEAVEILRAEDERGHVHHAFFKDAMLGRFYAICNCCACCCGAMQAHQNGTPMLAPSGYVCQVDQGLCLGCGACVDVCQFRALSLADELALVDRQACMGCGVCLAHCPQEALSLLRDPSQGEPLELWTLMDQAEEISPPE